MSTRFSPLEAPVWRSECPIIIRACAAPRYCIGFSLEYNSGYTGAVKTAISLPDELFRVAEATARKLRVSRSELYAKAIAEYLSRQQSNSVTERLNQTYSRSPAKLDPGLHRAQMKTLHEDAW